MGHARTTLHEAPCLALVTGADRGIGRSFARALIEHSAAKVYAGVRDPATVAEQDLTPLRLDVTEPDEIAEAAAVAGDVTIVINNAGIGIASSWPPSSVLTMRRAVRWACVL
ncbi:SDR family NAD(P)-dependent oxidoreductase [Streptomyces sp. NPDC001970]